MRRMTYFVMALAMVLGFTQCKKEQPANQTAAETVHITLNVENGSKHNVDPSGSVATVTFQSGDVIYVGNGSAYIGALTCDGTKFSGDIVEPGNGTKIYFYFVGGMEPSVALNDGSVSGDPTTSFTVDISDQSSKLPVLSIGSASYKGSGEYICTLENQCALVKFDLPSDVDGDIIATATGGKKMKTEATINFNGNVVTTSGESDNIKTFGTDDTRYAIVLIGQGETNVTLTCGSTYTDYFIIPAVSYNDFVTATEQP